ncbi:MAG: flippase-like domain-containing protein [Alphaproteobacteria bacterium]|nr:flippase-like domain-containing protein [Alphaproteobacteria bacterium]
MNRAFLFFLIKIFLTGIIIYFLVNNIDYTQLLVNLKKVPYHFLGFSIVLTIMGILATAQRWQKIICSISTPIPLWDACYHTAIGAFLSQCLPSSVGGDVYKGIILKQRYKISTTLSISTTLIDRLYGISSFVIFAILGCFVEWKSLIASSIGELVMAIITLVSGGLVALYCLKFVRIKLPSFLRPIINFSDAISLVFSHRVDAIIIFMTSLISSFCLIMGAYLLSEGIGLNLTVFQIFLCIPLVIIISAIPVSFAGWGLREGAMVVILSIYGIPKEEALAFSLLFGVVQFLAAFPGLILWGVATNPQFLLHSK